MKCIFPFFQSSPSSPSSNEIKTLKLHSPSISEIEDLDLLLPIRNYLIELDMSNRHLEVFAAKDEKLKKSLIHLFSKFRISPLIILDLSHNDLTIQRNDDLVHSLSKGVYNHRFLEVINLSHNSLGLLLEIKKYHQPSILKHDQSQDEEDDKNGGEDDGLCDYNLSWEGCDGLLLWDELMESFASINSLQEINLNFNRLSSHHLMSISKFLVSTTSPHFRFLISYFYDSFWY